MSLESRMRWRGYVRGLRRLITDEGSILVLLTIFTVVLAVISVGFPGSFPLTSVLIPLTIGSVLLGPRRLPWFVIIVLGVLVLAMTRQPTITPRIASGIVVIFVVGLIIMVTSFRRTELGVGGMRGESMLVDLRDRILHQARLPALPEGWYVESALRSASDTPFAGDLVLAARRGRMIDLVVADVSGKGRESAPSRCCCRAPSPDCSVRFRPPSSSRRPTAT
ncbi:hypothetical protein [Nocardioides alcanivorans]|uniref:hypothetical protein n=1 Tax=Nocardioides alcanivorans TaxID=2897352 RepID=UPI001F3E5594|nr:hypothetical protein [Nocardioides alcanivorans]